ncbi:hypothetical protein LTR86_004052 [Recurvomyces mirabilis]|nr:hypothetical protein LTR86_004052 [Recurvomyces mirabilis]
MAKRKGRAANRSKPSLPELPTTAGDWTQFLVPPRKFSQKQRRSGVGLDHVGLRALVDVNTRSNSLPCATPAEKLAASPSASSVHDSKHSSTPSASSDVSGTEPHELVTTCIRADGPACMSTAQLRANSTPVLTDQIDITNLHRLFTKARAQCLRDVCVHAVLRRSVGCRVDKGLVDTVLQLAMPPVDLMPTLKACATRQDLSAAAITRDDELDAAEEGQYFLPAGLLDDEDEGNLADHSLGARKHGAQTPSTVSRPSAFLEYDFRPHVSTKDPQCRSGAEVWGRDTGTKAFLDGLTQAKYCWHAFMITNPELAIQYLRTREHLHLWRMISEINENLAPHEIPLPLPQWPTRYLVDLTHDVKAVRHAMTRREARLLRQRLDSQSNGFVVGVGVRGKEVWDLLVAAARSCVRDARLGLEDLVVFRDPVVSGLWMGSVTGDRRHGDRRDHLYGDGDGGSEGRGGAGVGVGEEGCGCGCMSYFQS